MIKVQTKASMRAFAGVLTLAAAGAAGLFAWDAVAQTGTAPGPFTDAQAQAGQAVFSKSCASCHEAGGETIRLISSAFTDVWRTRTTNALYTRIKTTMPFGNPGSRSEAEAASVGA